MNESAPAASPPSDAEREDDAPLDLDVRSALRPIVVSPHLDDGIFGCGALLAQCGGGLLVTVFAGCPPDPHATTEWDRHCGFESAGQAMHARRAEDRRAAMIVGCRVRHLRFLDAQYARSPDVDRLTSALSHCSSTRDGNAIFVPLGLFHSDHALVSDACLALVGRPGGAFRFFVYADAIYRRSADRVAERIDRLSRRDALRITPASIDTTAGQATKQRAVACYASQLGALGPQARHEIAMPEQFWSVRVPGPVRIRVGSQPSTTVTTR